MSLLSLKKSTPSASELGDCDVDAFIDGAIYYAQGLGHGQKVVPLESFRQRRYRRATFTLTDEAIDRLGQLSSHTGIAKSRLIRIWLADCDDLQPYLTSRVP